MNHAQLQSCQRLHETATVASGLISVEAEDVRNLLDAAGDAYRTMEQMTSELREAKTQLLERAVVEPIRETPIPLLPAITPPGPSPVIVTPAEAGS